MPPPMTAAPPDRIDWLAWDVWALDRAARTRRPILLALGPAWCEGRRRMDEMVYTDPSVATIVRDQFVPIRVDTDRRPDIAERYTLSGWPTSACLTPDGELLTGGVLLDVPDLVSMLTETAEAYRVRGPELEARAQAASARRAVERRSTRPRPADATPVGDWLEREALAAFDPVHGGFGDAYKWPNVPLLRFVIRRYADGADPRLRDLVTRTIDGMADGGLLDAIEGGFFRYAEGADWSAPHTEKLLAVNADCLRLYLDAWTTFDRARDRDAIEMILGYLGATLWSDADRGFFSSQAADATYYALDSIEARRTRPAPDVDPTIYVSSNARMVSALLATADVTGDQEICDRAIDVLERLLSAYQPGHGIAHVVTSEPDIRGQLGDQIFAAQAVLDAFEASGNEVYLDLSKELLLYCERVLWDPDEGGFLDRDRAIGDADVGLLLEPVKPLDLNADAACALVRIAKATRHEDDERRATEARAWCRDEHRTHGLMAAPYALAECEAADSN